MRIGKMQGYALMHGMASEMVRHPGPVSTSAKWRDILSRAQEVKEVRATTTAKVFFPNGYDPGPICPLCEDNNLPDPLCWLCGGMGIL